MKSTMKQLTLVSLFLCISSAAGLQCLTSSSTSVTCYNETMCYSGAFSGYVSKGCGSSYNCTVVGSQFSSYNYGTGSYLQNITCCDTDNCNSANMSTPPAGSLKCYGCDPLTYQCRANVTCNELETCGHGIVSIFFGPSPIYGCVSENLCNSYFPISYPHNPVSCCNTSNCNVPDLGLQCMTCNDSTCSSQYSVSCSKYSPMCLSYLISVSYGSGNYTYNGTYISKGCGSPSDCTSAGTEIISFNYGTGSYILNTTCCNTDNCNSDMSISVSPPAGSLQCYVCPPYSDKCNATVTCNAVETCAYVTYNNINFFSGCVSENLCDHNVSQQYFGSSFLVSCCNTNLCNDKPPSALIFLNMRVSSLGNVSNATVTEQLKLFFGSLLNGTALDVTVTNITTVT